MDLVLKIIDKKRIAVKRNSEGCQADIYYAVQNDLGERICMPIKVKATMHRNLDTNHMNLIRVAKFFPVWLYAML